MKLDRDINSDGYSKYAVLNLRRIDQGPGNAGPFGRWSPEVAQAIAILEDAGAIEYGQTGHLDEFFVLKLRDENADVALQAYAAKASRTDPEYGLAVAQMAERAGHNNPHCKSPD